MKGVQFSSMTMQMLFISAFFVLIGCKNNGNGALENRIALSISENCKDENCIVDISKITPFTWHKMYVFKETASLEAIENALNQKYPYYNDVARRLIFLDSIGTIVYHEDIFPNVEGVMNNGVLFQIPDTSNYRVFTQSIFTVTTEKLDNRVYYVLNQ